MKWGRVQLVEKLATGRSTDGGKPVLTLLAPYFEGFRRENRCCWEFFNKLVVSAFALNRSIIAPTEAVRHGHFGSRAIVCLNSPRRVGKRSLFMGHHQPKSCVPSATMTTRFVSKRDSPILWATCALGTSDVARWIGQLHRSRLLCARPMSPRVLGKYMEVPSASFLPHSSPRSGSRIVRRQRACLCGFRLPITTARSSICSGRNDDCMAARRAALTARS